MTDQEQRPPDGMRKDLPLWVRGVVRLVAVCAFISIPLFWGAGTLDWQRGWAFLALLALTFAVNLTLLLNKNPTLVRERWKRRKDTKRFDKTFGWAYLVVVVAFFVLAGSCYKLPFHEQRYDSVLQFITSQSQLTIDCACFVDFDDGHARLRNQ